jgi:alkylation response protein AidB-like acyl-CoA dehydrogenase
MVWKAANHFRKCGLLGMCMVLERAIFQNEGEMDSLRAIRDSVGAVVPSDGTLARIRALRFARLGYDPAVLALMGEMGWISLLIPEDQGGSGLGAREFCAICERLGTGLAPEPLIQASLSAGILARCGASAFLAGAVGGASFVATAWQEEADTLEVPGNASAPRRFIASANGASCFLIPVRRGGEFKIVSFTADAVRLATVATQDGGHYCTVEFDLPKGQVVGRESAKALERALDMAALATAAYLVGVMEAALSLTVEYLRNRKQFGRPIGSFQALQHRAVDLKTRLELARASVSSAADEVDRDVSGPLARKAVSRAKASASHAAMRITRESIQMHGAIGFTDEYDAGLYLRKAMVLAGQFGSARYHRKRFLALDDSND